MKQCLFNTTCVICKKNTGSLKANTSVFSNGSKHLVQKAFSFLKATFQTTFTQVFSFSSVGFSAGCFADTTQSQYILSGTVVPHTYVAELVLLIFCINILHLSGTSASLTKLDYSFLPPVLQLVSQGWLHVSAVELTPGLPPATSACSCSGTSTQRSLSRITTQKQPRWPCRAGTCLTELVRLGFGLCLACNALLLTSQEPLVGDNQQISTWDRFALQFICELIMGTNPPMKGDSHGTRQDVLPSKAKLWIHLSPIAVGYETLLFGQPVSLLFPLIFSCPSMNDSTC